MAAPPGIKEVHVVIPKELKPKEGFFAEFEADTELDLQDLYDQCKDREDDAGYMDDEIICTATGKQVLTATVSVAITLQMENTWKVAFAARAGPTYTLCFIVGGNIVDSSQVIGAWLEPTSFVQVFYGASSSATLVNASGTALTAQQTRNAMQLAPTGTTEAGSIDQMLEEVWQVETGTWKIVGTQMIFYKRDGTTEIFRRDLKDVSGNASNTDVFEGVRV